jgi:hypothetical protein
MRPDHRPSCGLQRRGSLTTAPRTFLKFAQSLSCVLPWEVKFTVGSASIREQMEPFLCLGGGDIISSEPCESEG